MRNKNRCAPEPLSQSLMEMSKLVDELDNNLAIDDNLDIKNLEEDEDEQQYNGKEEVIRRLQSMPDLCQR